MEFELLSDSVELRDENHFVALFGRAVVLNGQDVLQFYTEDANGKKRYWIAPTPKSLGSEARKKILDYVLGEGCYVADEEVTPQDIFLQAEFLKEVQSH